MVLNAKKMRHLAEVAFRRKVAPDPSNVDASAPADALVAAISASAPVDHRQKREVEATASKNEDTCSGIVFKRK